MNWLDYLRGYEEGRYDGGVSGRDTGLFGSLIQLAFSLVWIAIALLCFACKIILMLVWMMMKKVARRL